MSKDKYLWTVGSPAPLLDRHSQTKHLIIEEYVKKYVSILMAQPNIPELRLSIIDGFCGGGCYQTEDGSITDGTPVLMMKAIREARMLLNHERRMPRSIDAEFFFIDILADTTDYLKYILNAKLDENLIDLIDYKKTKIFNDSFLKSLPLIIESIKKRKRGERALFLLDQYSYKDIPLPDISNLLRTLKGAEVLMTFNVDNLTTYLSDRANNRKPLENIGLDTYIPWTDLLSLKATHKREWRQTLQQHLAHGIKCESGAKYMTLFFIKPHGLNSWGYWLIHLSNTYRAHAAMKSLHWEHATEFGHELSPGIFSLGYNANKDYGYTGQETFEFSADRSKDVCINQVQEYFGRSIYALQKPTSLFSIFEKNITNSTGAEPHLMEAVRRLHQSKEIIISSKDGAIRRNNKAYKLHDIIEPSKQIILT